MKKNVLVALLLSAFSVAAFCGNPLSMGVYDVAVPGVVSGLGTLAVPAGDPPPPITFSWQVGDLWFVANWYWVETGPLPGDGRYQRQGGTSTAEFTSVDSEDLSGSVEYTDSSGTAHWGAFAKR